MSTPAQWIRHGGPYVSFPRGHVAHRIHGLEVFKQYNRFMDYVQAILLIRQPEVYVNTIFVYNAVEFFITWKRTDTQEMCHVTITFKNTPGLAKEVTTYITAFHNIVSQASTLGDSPYADLFI